MGRGSVGVQIGATTAPTDVGHAAKEAERLGYREIWMAEDYFQLGGISSVTTALGATERIPIGLGVVAASVRHPAVTAMEFAAMGATYPGRFMAGIGHGATGWLRQMGLQPESPLGLLREATDSIGHLLRGAEITRAGDYFAFDRVRLHHSPAQSIPLYLGVHGPASLRLSGELANGTLLGWFSSPGYITWARERIEEGRALANREDKHELVVLCLLSVSEDEPIESRRALGRWVTPMLAGMTESPQLKSSDKGRELLEFIESDRTVALAQGPPDLLLAEFVAAGDISSCGATIQAMLDGGADRVILVPNPAGYRTTAEMLAQMRLASSLTGL